jgi:hypothetical protein
MAEISERVAVELENIDGVLARIPAAEALSGMSELEVAGVAALIHSFYNGIENVLKQVLLAKGKTIPSGESWHKELVQLAFDVGVLSQSGSMAIREYLAFRHFFAHAYAFDLDPHRMEPLVANLPAAYRTLRQDVIRAITRTS